MSKRDTIIIALLVNVSLLALLFMLAVNTEDEGVLEPAPVTKSALEPKEKLKTGPSTVVLADFHVSDEVDSFLKELAAVDKEKQPPLMLDDDGYIQLSKEGLASSESFQNLNSTQDRASNPQESVRQDASQDTSQTSHFVNVTVKRGDALEKIARSNGTTVEAIKKANNLTSARLSIGQTLRIPVSRKRSNEIEEKTEDVYQQKGKPKEKVVAAAAKDVERKGALSDAVYYTIKSGDSPWKIAKQHNVPFDELLKLNHLNEESARSLKIGDRIRVK